MFIEQPAGLPKLASLPYTLSSASRGGWCVAWTWGHCRRLVSDTCYDSPACGSVCGFDPRCRDCPRRCLRTSIPTSMPPCALHLNTRVSVVLARFKCRNHGIHLNQFPRTPWEVITPLRSCHAGPCPLTCHSKKLSLGVVPAKLLCGFFFLQSYHNQQTFYEHFPSVHHVCFSTFTFNQCTFSSTPWPQNAMCRLHSAWL